MNRKTIVFCVFLVVVLTVPCFPLMLKLSLEELTGYAEIIVTGKVVEKECRWGEEVKCIYTYVTVSVDEYIKGGGEDKVVLVHPGGEVGRKGMMVSNMPSFQEGEEVLIFARRLEHRLARLAKKEDSGVIYRVSGFAQGKYRIFVDETGRKMVRNSFSNLCTHDRDGMRILDEDVLSDKALSEFISEIEGIVEEEKCEE